jgi:hypothetical protein
MTTLKWAIVMLLVSLVATLFGFTELSAASADVRAYPWSLCSSSCWLSG